MTASAIDAIETDNAEPQQQESIAVTEPITTAPESTTTPETTTAPEVTDIPKPTTPIYSIPLSEELQTYTFRLCEKYGVDYEMVLALMEIESRYRPDIISDTNDYGLMQINSCNHADLEDKLGVTDILDPEQNIHCGVYLLGKLAAKYDDPHRILMAYNMGERGARKYIENGNTTSAYSRAIMERRAELLQTKP